MPRIGPDRSMTFSRRSFVGLGAAAWLAACSKGASGRSDTLFVGDQRGGSKAVLDASHNLDRLTYRIDWSAFPNAAPLLEALNVGAIDTGIGGDAPFIFAIGSGAAVKAIGAQKYEGLGAALVVRGDSSIRSLGELKGQRIATPRGSNGHNFILSVLEAHGQPLDAVRFAFLSPQDGQAAMQSGAVDGWAIWDPYVALAERQGARIVPGGEAVGPICALIFGANGAVADKRPLLADYRRRLFAGWTWAVDHPGEYSEVLYRETGVARDVWKTVTGRRHMIPTGIDEKMIAEQQRIADRYLHAGLIANPISVRTAFDRSFT